MQGPFAFAHIIQDVMPKSPESEILAKSFADMGEKCGAKMAKLFADFRPSIFTKSGRKKLHERLATNSAGSEINSFTASFWELRGTKHGLSYLCVRTQ